MSALLVSCLGDTYNGLAPLVKLIRYWGDLTTEIVTVESRGGVR